ncbi:MAG: amidohydrolase family protein [Cyclobacteriaceae bacterium]
MKRRSFIKQVGLITVGLGASMSAYSFQQKKLVLVLRNGRVFQNNALTNLDVGVDATGKLITGASGSLQADEIIDVSGKVISPGFIDILADNTANPMRTHPIFEKFKVSDGVTTALQMHGGSATTASYYNSFKAFPHRINYGVSTAVMQVRYRTGNAAERVKMVEQCLAEGALGVSHSIEYQPTPYDEVLTYAKLAKKYDRPFFLHLRYSSTEQELDGVKEAIRIARESGARVHIDHLHSTGGTFHMADALTLIRQANKEGLTMTCCVYPYSFWATYLHSKRFDDGWQKRYNLTYNDLRLVGTGERLTKESFAKYREMKKLVAVPDGTLPLETTVDLALKEDFCMIGSDGGIEYAVNANSHPRGAGCFSTSIRHAQEIGMPLERILNKVTSMQRTLIGAPLKERGIIADGAYADITVFDPIRINGKASVANPNQFSDGIELVLVNGKVAYRGQKLMDSAGMPIRY